MPKKPANLGKALVLGAVTFAAIGFEARAGWRPMRPGINPLPLAVSFIAVCMFFEDIRKLVLYKPEPGRNRFVELLIRGEGIILAILATYWVATG